MYKMIKNSMGWTLKLHWNGHIYHRFEVRTRFKGLQIVKSLGLHVNSEDRLLA